MSDENSQIVAQLVRLINQHEAYENLLGEIFVTFNLPGNQEYIHPLLKGVMDKYQEHFERSMDRKETKMPFAGCEDIEFPNDETMPGT